MVAQEGLDDEPARHGRRPAREGRAPGLRGVRRPQDAGQLAGHVRGHAPHHHRSHERSTGSRTCARSTVPALVLVGEEDAPFRKPSARMAEAIPGAELVVIPDAGHSPQFETPDAWWEALQAFLDRV